MENIYNLPTVKMIEAVKLIEPKETFLLDTFFSNKLPVADSEWVSVEYKKGRRLLAPYIVEGAKAVTLEREGSQVKMYNAPMLGMRRVITSKDLSRRMFGETPVYSEYTAAERADRILAEDFEELISAIQTKKNYMAAELLQTGKIIVEGYADDGSTIRADTIDFNMSNVSTVNNSWATANTDIYKDIYNAVNKIAEEVGELPDIMVVGKNVEQYILSNKTTEKWLMIPNAQYANFANLSPKYLSPQARYIGRINALGLEVYSYLGTYFDGTSVKPFIDEDTAIIGIGGRGKQVLGAVTLVEGGNWNTYAAEYVPHYTYSEKDNITCLSMYSRFVPVPEVVGTWETLKVVC